ncbi:MAG: nitroreductase [Nostocales cyanobacterium]|nr:MAG: nitroreductase [Nostocales cyanobacterium]TAF08923.1 MAG: nitroreductase [Nostocales cyanobacterium]
MEKPAKPEYPIHKLLEDRWSPLAFSSKPITPETISSLLEVARWTASCYNEQPWRFIIATQENTAEFNKLLSCIVEANQVWAKNAPVLMISVAKLNFDQNGKPNRHAAYDLGAAVCSLTTQATSLGLFVHQMGGFDVAKTKELYNIPEDYEPMTAIAIGYAGDPQSLPPQYQQREFAERQRHPQDTFRFTNIWGNR